MRILIVTEQYPPMIGGVASVTSALARNLADAGHRVWVAAPSETHEHIAQMDHRVHVRRFASFEAPSFDGQRIALLPVAQCHHLLRAVRPDVIHIHQPLVLGNLMLLLAAIEHIPVVGTNHYMPVNVAPGVNPDALLGRSVEAITYSFLVGFYNRCDFVTAPSETALALLKRHGLRPPARAISNGVDVRRFFPGPRDEALRQRLGLPDDRPLILAVGRLSKEKHLHTLLDAFAQLRIPAHLAIGGSGPARAELEHQARALGIARRVTFLGHIEDADLAPLYRLGDVFAIASIAELQSLVTLEAMAVGLPVVAADAGALPELVHDGENGLLFPPDDSAALAHRLAALAEDPAMRRAMSARSLAIAISHDSEHVLAQWERQYAELARGTLARTAPRSGRRTTHRTGTDRREWSTLADDSG